MNKRLQRIRLWMVMLRRLCLFVCAALIITAAVVNIEEITADNMRRILAKLDVTFERGASISDFISYPESRDNNFILFKGGLAVLSPERLRIYDAAGVSFLDKEMNLSSPAINASKRFVLTYDRGGTRLNIYNSFACVFSAVYDGGILSARINSFGYLSVLTRAAGYNALLTVYDTSFREVYKRWYSEGRFAFACDVSQNGKKALVIILKASLDGFKSELELLDLSKESPLASVDAGGELPFEARFLTNDRVVVAGERGCRFFDGKGTFISSVMFEDSLINLYSDEGIIGFACARDGEGHSVLRLLNADGKQMVKHESEGLTKSVCAFKDYIAGLTDETLTVAFAGGNVREFPVTKKHRAVLAASARHVLLISGDHAEYIEIR